MSFLHLLFNTNNVNLNSSPPTAAMSDPATTTQSAVVIGTSIVALLTGFLLGLRTARGHILPPELAETRRRALSDPVESDEGDISEDDCKLDHAPNWANGVQADRRDGLRQRGGGGVKELAGKLSSSSSSGRESTGYENEECKLVLVVRTDLGMTKGELV